MKIMIFPMLLAIAMSTSVAATKVVPSVTGTISAVNKNGSQTQITMNGQTYAVATDRVTGTLVGKLQPGQAVTLMLGADGKTVIAATQPAEENAK